MSHAPAMRLVHPEDSRDSLLDCLTDLVTPFESLAALMEDADRADLAQLLRVLVRAGYAQAGRIDQALSAFAGGPLEAVYRSLGSDEVWAVVRAQEAAHV